MQNLYKMRYIFLFAALHLCRASRRLTQCSDILDRNSKVLASRWMMNVTTLQYILAPPLTIRPSFRLQYPIMSTNSNRRNSSILIIHRTTNNRLRIIIKVTFLRNRHPLRQRQSFHLRIIDRIHLMVWLSPSLWFMEHHPPSPTSPLP